MAMTSNSSQDGKSTTAANNTNNDSKLSPGENTSSAASAVVVVPDTLKITTQIQTTAPSSLMSSSTSSSSPTHADVTPRGEYEKWEPGLAKRIRDLVDVTEATESSEAPFPYCLVALVGVPGSHRALSGFLLANILEEVYGIESMILQSSGYHFPLDILKNFPDAEDAIYRRGAPDTFDPHALLRDLRLIKGLDTLQEDTHCMSFPGFDQRKADPQPDKHTFDRTRHKVVICEGKYLLHDEQGWEDIKPMFDLTVFMDSDVEECLDRLKIRNQCIPGYSPEEIVTRCDTVDRDNARVVLKSRKNADVIVQAQSRPVLQSEQPEEPSVQMAALTLLAQKDVDGAETNVNSDWAMDIFSRRPRGDSVFSILSRTNSFVSHKDDPEPAAQSIGVWEPEVAKRVQSEIKKRLAALPPGSDESKVFPYMVALVGIPGSGKSVSSFVLANTLDEMGYPCMICPHDGYHYPLDYLKTFPEAEDFVYRRGAPDTFDPRALYRDLDRIKNDTEGGEVIIKLPAFDHATADPEPDTHIFDRHFHKAVLCEGLYLLHDEDGWEDIASLFDLTIFMSTDVDVCIERVKIRNRCIPGYTTEEIELRCEQVDRVNAMTVMKSKARADMVVDSLATKK